MAVGTIRHLPVDGDMEMDMEMLLHECLMPGDRERWSRQLIVRPEYGCSGTFTVVQFRSHSRFQHSVTVWVIYA